MPTDDEYQVLPTLPGYRFGADGSVWSCLPVGRPPGAAAEWRRLQPRGRRPRVVLRLAPRDGRDFSLARLVCEAWHGPPPSAAAQVAFADGDPSNVAAANLSWAAVRSLGRPAALLTGGSPPPPEPRRGLTAEQVQAAGRMRADGASLAAIAAILGVRMAVVKASLTKG